MEMVVKVAVVVVFYSPNNLVVVFPAAIISVLDFPMAGSLVEMTS